VVFSALPDTIGFIIAMFFVFFGFSLSHFLAYGDEVEGFQTLNDCFLTLYRQMLGDFPTVDAEEQSNRLLGPAFFVAWTAIASILLLNMFTAIVIDGFEKVRSEVEKVGFLHFMNNQALPPFQNALKKLRKLAEGGDDDDEESDDDDDNEVGREVLKNSAAAEKDEDGEALAPTGGNVESEHQEDEKMELVLQAVLTLSREVRVLSRRVKTLSDTASKAEVVQQ